MNHPSYIHRFRVLVELFFGSLSLCHWVHSHLSGKSRQTQAYMARFGLSKSQVRAKTCGILAKIIREIRVSYRITMEIRIYLTKITIEDYSQLYENREPACFRMKIYSNQQQAKRLPATHRTKPKQSQFHERGQFKPRDPVFNKDMGKQGKAGENKGKQGKT